MSYIIPYDYYRHLNDKSRKLITKYSAKTDRVAMAYCQEICDIHEELVHMTENDDALVFFDRSYWRLYLTYTRLNRLFRKHFRQYTRKTASTR